MIPISNLEFGWFTVFVILLTGYIILDGFDLGVGMVHLFSKTDRERRTLLNAIGPLWDGNEVWLVTAGGALLAGFPGVYATLLSAFYTPVMALLSGLIFRAVAIEFRSKRPSKVWRTCWDTMFSLGSFLIALILGVFMGNLIRGIPLDEYGEFSGHLGDLFHPYALLVGVFAVALFIMHGCIFILMKTEGEFHDTVRKWVYPAIITFTLVYAITTMATLIYMPHMLEAFQERPFFFLIAILNVVAVANIPREIYFGRDARAFLSSCMNMICLMALYAIGSYPQAVRAINNPAEYSLTIYNSSASTMTLEILFLVAFIGAPLVISYTIVIYYIFRGKVKIDTHSY